MTGLILDSGGLSRLSRPHGRSVALIEVLMRDGLWPPLVPSVVLAESVSGRPRTDVMVNRFLKTCLLVEEVSERVARRAGALRAESGRGSAVDAIVVALAEPGGAVLTADIAGLGSLAYYADKVQVLVA